MQISVIRAVIIKGDSILLIRREKKDQPVYYSFPGGHVEVGEDPIEALKRECNEELGVEVDVGKQVFEQVYEGMAQAFYYCRIVKGEVSKTMGGPEANRNFEMYGNYDIEWIPLVKVAGINVLPAKLKDMLPSLVG